jgi:hypothetical protein
MRKRQRILVPVDFSETSKKKWPRLIGVPSTRCAGYTPGRRGGKGPGR